MIMEGLSFGTEKGCLIFRHKMSVWMSLWTLVIVFSLSYCCSSNVAEAFSIGDGNGGSEDLQQQDASAADPLEDSPVIEVDDGSSDSSGSSREVVKCVCDGSCEHLRAEECQHGVTFDMCRCCLVCARGENEPCGGARGTCAFGLHCQLNDEAHSVALNDINSTTATPLLQQEGTCSRVGRCGQLQDQYGCVVDPEGECVCLTRRACPGEKMFLFEDEASCRSRMAFLIAKKDLEPATNSAILSAAQQMMIHPATGQ